LQSVKTFLLHLILLFSRWNFDEILYSEISKGQLGEIRGEIHQFSYRSISRKIPKKMDRFSPISNYSQSLKCQNYKICNIIVLRKYQASPLQKLFSVSPFLNNSKNILPHCASFEFLFRRVDFSYIFRENIFFFNSW
jgi:hypothetical protein